MKISGFTICRNAVKFNYPLLESIRSILPLCDEFIVNVGDSEDGTLALIESLRNDKIKIVQTIWDFTQGKEVLSQQTNVALSHCRGDWAFYLQSDEVVHEDDLPRLKALMEKHRRDDNIDALRFKWLHFYGSYYRYRIDHGWYQKQDRIVRNNGQVESMGDAWGFQRKDGRPLRQVNTGCLLYHYGWVQSEAMVTQRRVNAERIGFTSLKENERREDYSFGDLGRFPVYFGTHPQVMVQRIGGHLLSQQDAKAIGKKYWWFPAKILKMRYKTGRRVKERIT